MTRRTRRRVDLPRRRRGRRSAALGALAALLGAGCDPPNDLSPEGIEAEAAACPVAPTAPIPGAPPRFVALNAYYLQEEAARAVRDGAPPGAHVEEVFRKAVALGATVIRTNAFNDDPAKTGDTAIQVAPLVYDETSLVGLDWVLARASAWGVKLVLPLGNYWDAYGGARQYVAWAGLPNPAEGDPRFFTDRAVIDHYVAHVRRLLSRTSTVDGIRYGEHPAVLAWEILNEPRGRGLDASGAALRAWVDEVARAVKEAAPGHLVGTGEEGFEASSRDPFWPTVGLGWATREGSSFALDTASPWIDVASVHFYADAWGIPEGFVAMAGARWISDHADVARSLGKPLLVGEFGLRNDGPWALAQRRAAYRGWLACARTAGAAGAAPWLFAYDERPDAWDPQTFYFRDGTEPGDPVNRYADLVLEASALAAGAGSP